MFIRAILARDVRAGDIIRVNRICPAGRQFRVISAFADGEIAWLHNETQAGVECSGIECQPDEVVHLVYRPYPPGKTESDMFSAVEQAASAFLMLREYGYDEFAEQALGGLCEALSTFEAGKSFQRK